MLILHLVLWHCCNCVGGKEDFIEGKSSCTCVFSLWGSKQL